MDKRVVGADLQALRRRIRFVFHKTTTAYFRRLLSQANTAHTSSCLYADFWCCWRGLNSRPLPYQGSALPLSYSSTDSGPKKNQEPDVGQTVPCKRLSGKLWKRLSTGEAIYLPLKWQRFLSKHQPPNVPVTIFRLSLAAVSTAPLFCVWPLTLMCKRSVVSIPVWLSTHARSLSPSPPPMLRPRLLVPSKPNPVGAFATPAEILAPKLYESRSLLDVSRRDSRVKL